MSDEISEEILAKAKDMGHVPLEEWKGDPDKWTPPDEYVKRGEMVLPIVRKELDRTKQELDMALKMNKAEVERIKAESYERAKQEYQEKLRELDTKEFEAVQEADEKKYQEIKQERAQLKPPDTPKKPDTNPEFIEWHKKNTWYTTDLNNPGDADRDMTLFANTVAVDMRKANPNLTPNELYQRVEEKIKANFPHKFENPNRKKADMTDGSGHAGTSSGGKGWKDLPAEAKREYQRFADRAKQKGREYKKEDYVKVYFEE